MGKHIGIAATLYTDDHDEAMELCDEFENQNEHFIEKASFQISDDPIAVENAYMNLNFSPTAIIEHFDGDDKAEALTEVLVEDPEKFKKVCIAHAGDDNLYAVFTHLCDSIARELGVE